MGDIRKFITDDVLMNHKRVFSRGHCSVYENSPEVNSFYRSLPKCNCQDWKKVFQSEISCCFDEWAGHLNGGISEIMKRNGIKIYDEVCIADINVKSGCLQINRMPKYKNVYFVYKDGKLKLMSNNISREVLYVHFQKRKMDIETNINYDLYYFVAPNHITSDKTKIRKNFREEKMFELGKLLKRLQNKLR